jgi:magnesium-transporting ATPase (P-type)
MTGSTPIGLTTSWPPRTFSLAFLHELRTGTLESARTHAFGALVFAELFRALAARSESVPLWKLSIHSNYRLLAVVGFSAALQILSHFDGLMAGLLRTSYLPLSDTLRLIVIGAIPVLILQARHLRWPFNRRPQHP